MESCPHLKAHFLPYNYKNYSKEQIQGNTTFEETLEPLKSRSNPDTWQKPNVLQVFVTDNNWKHDNQGCKLSFSLSIYLQIILNTNRLVDKMSEL